MWTRKNNIKEEGGKRGRKEQRNQERKRKEGNRVAGSYMYSRLDESSEKQETRMCHEIFDQFL